MTIVLSGRRDGTTHREVALLASLPPELRLIGGLAVMCRVGTPHRATVDLDAVARNLPLYHPLLAHLAVASSSGGQYRFAGDLDLDVIDVATMPTSELIAQLQADGLPFTDLEFNVVAHNWAHDSASEMDISAVDDATGVVLVRAEGRLVASTAGIVAMKATTVPLRASSRPEKRASDLYDIGRLLVAGGLRPNELADLPAPLDELVRERLYGWFVEGSGRDRTYREVRRFDEPRMDLDEVGDAVKDTTSAP